MTKHIPDKDSSLYGVQEGDKYYSIREHEANLWIVHTVRQRHICITNEGDDKLTLTKDSWYTLIATQIMVAHEDLIHAYGEEALFQHLLADTLLELLTLYTD